MEEHCEYGKIYLLPFLDMNGWLERASCEPSCQNDSSAQLPALGKAELEPS
jgi:hypothetical protein